MDKGLGRGEENLRELYGSDGGGQRGKTRKEYLD